MVVEVHGRDCRREAGRSCDERLGNAGRVLYHVWDAILEKKKDNSLRVNLLMNRASPWADLASHLPYEGKVVLKMKQDSNVEMRIPSWTNRNKVQCFLRRLYFCHSGIDT